MMAPMTPAQRCTDLWLAYSAPGAPALAYVPLDMTDADVIRIMAWAARDEMERPDTSPARLAARYRAYTAYLRDTFGDDLDGDKPGVGRHRCAKCGDIVPCDLAAGQRQKPVAT